LCFYEIRLQANRLAVFGNRAVVITFVVERYATVEVGLGVGGSFPPPRHSRPLVIPAKAGIQRAGSSGNPSRSSGQRESKAATGTKWVSASAGTTPMRVHGLQAQTDADLKVDAMPDRVTTFGLDRLTHEP